MQSLGTPVLLSDNLSAQPESCTLVLPHTHIPIITDSQSSETPLLCHGMLITSPLSSSGLRSHHLLSCCFICSPSLSFSFPASIFSCFICSFPLVPFHYNSSCLVPFVFPSPLLSSFLESSHVFESPFVFSSFLLSGLLLFPLVLFYFTSPAPDCPDAPPEKGGFPLPGWRKAFTSGVGVQVSFGFDHE